MQMRKKGYIDPGQAILGVVAVIIVILAILQSSPTVITASATGTGSSLENGSALTKLVAGFVQVGFIL